MERGDTIAHFEIEDELGSGAMGVVYRARDQRLGRDVALKVLPPEAVGAPRRRARFLREARAVAAINHPNVATVYDVGETGDTAYISMEYVSGRTLRDLIRNQRLPTEQVVEVLSVLAAALAAAHDAGVIHRDLKPANVMISGDGTVKLLDFGLAKALGAARGEKPFPEDATLSTGENAILGTPAYMSPEQCHGCPADRRSDVFAFGVVAYELLAGRRPFVAEDYVELGWAIIHDEPSWSALGPHVPVELCRMVRKCLAKAPDDRYQNFHEIADLLATLPRAPVARDRPAAWRRFAPGLALVGVLALVVMLWPAGQAAPPRPRLHEVQLTSFHGREAVSTVALTHDGTRIAYTVKSFRQRVLWFRDLPAGRPYAVALWPGVHGLRALDFYPDGERLLVRTMTSQNTPTVGTLDLRQRTITPWRDGIFVARLSPDAKRIVFFVSNGIMVAGEGGRGERLIASMSPGEQGYQLAWSPDGKYIAAIVVRVTGHARDQFLEVFSADGSSAVRIPTGPLSDTSGVVWIAPDRLVYSRIARTSGTDLCAARVVAGRWDGRAPRCLYHWNSGDIDEFQFAAGRLVYIMFRAAWSIVVADVGPSGGLVGRLRELPGQDGDHHASGWLDDQDLVGWTRSDHRIQPLLYNFDTAPALLAGTAESGRPIVSAHGVAFMQTVPDGDRDFCALIAPRGGPPVWSEAAGPMPRNCPRVFCSRGLGARCVLVRIADDYSFRVVDLDSGAESGPVRNRPAEQNDFFDLSPGGDVIAWGIERVASPAVALLRLDTGEYTEVRPRGGLLPHDVSWTLDGSGWFVTGNDHGHVLARMQRDGSYSILYRDDRTPTSLHDPKPSPDGRHLALTAKHEEQELFMLEGAWPN